MKKEYSYNKDHLQPNHYKEFYIDVENNGWESAIDNLKKRPDVIKPQKIEMFLADEKRNDFIFLLPLKADSTVLDFGSGWGNTSYTIADHCRRVIAMEADKNRLKFSAEHFKFKGKDNIYPVISGNSKYLPLDDEEIDIALMNGVLEWTPMALKGKPDQVHRTVLAEMHRVLKSDGHLFISIENRFGYMYLLGKKDHHCGGLKWVTFLPRYIANIYSYLVLRRPYRAWLYSFSELKKLLENSGYTDIKFYSYFKNHVRYNYIFQLDNTENLKKKLREIISTQNLGFKEKIFYQLGAYFGGFKYVAQDFMVVARKK